MNRARGSRMDAMRAARETNEALEQAMYGVG
jgi:hypothetical protein